jgi:aminopeptidase S
VRLAGIVLAVALIATACGGVEPSPPIPSPTAVASDGPLVRELVGRVTVAGAWPHLEALQKIADSNDGNRASGTAGYDASVEYVVGALRTAGFEVTTPTYTARGRKSRNGPQRNVIAQTTTGDPDHVVMIGAHLDSVEEGPGIVDDGSGVAGLLEIAARLGPDPAVRQQVRFAFFGDEENGARGSTGYLDGLSDADRGKIMAYLNVDMIASPNGGYFVQGGTGEDADTAGPPGSAAVGQVLADHLARTGVSPERIAFVGDDESPFVKAGIPVGGAENGDAEKKSDAQAKAWGGQAGETYDKCYHSECDRLDKVNRDVFNRYLRAIAGTLAHLATTPDPLP